MLIPAFTDTDMRDKIHKNITWLVDIDPWKHLHYLFKNDVLSIDEYEALISAAEKNEKTLVVRL